MKIIFSFLLVIFFLGCLPLTAQENLESLDLFNQFIDRNATRDDLAHLAPLLKESEFSSFARAIAEELLSRDFGDLPRGWPKILKDSEKTIAELQADGLATIWNHHVNSKRPENYLILLKFIEEDWGFDPDKTSYERYFPTNWRGRILGQILRFFKNTEEIEEYSDVKVQLLCGLSKVLNEDRIPNADQATILNVLFVYSDPNRNFDSLITIAERIRPLWKKDIFLMDSFERSCFNRLSPENKELFLRLALSCFADFQKNEVGSGVFFARYLAPMLGCDISRWHNHNKGGEEGAKINQKIVDAVGKALREKLDSGI